jgi:hypothetical protein
MLSLVLSDANGATKHLGPAREILRCAQDDKLAGWQTGNMTNVEVVWFYSGSTLSC